MICRIAVHRSCDFDYWSGDLSDTTNPAVLEVPGDMNIRANFTQDTSGIADDPAPDVRGFKLYGTFESVCRSEYEPGCQGDIEVGDRQEIAIV